MSVQITVPDIGDFSDVEVIELLVSEGDVIEVEQGLVTVESEKASMELPADQAGKVLRVLVKVGDKISQGSPLVEIEPAEAKQGESANKPDVTSTSGEKGDRPVPAADTTTATTAAPSSKASAHYSGKADAQCDVLVLGAGP